MERGVRPCPHCRHAGPQWRSGVSGTARGLCWRLVESFPPGTAGHGPVGLPADRGSTAAAVAWPWRAHPQVTVSQRTVDTGLRPGLRMRNATARFGLMLSIYPCGRPAEPSLALGLAHGPFLRGHGKLAGGGLLDLGPVAQIRPKGVFLPLRLVPQLGEGRDGHTGVAGCYSTG